MKSTAAALPDAAARDRLLAVAAAVLLGVFLLWGAAFVPLPTLHDAAHDTRHGFAFPCH
ncbi:MAG TPA: CbtB domain-containing protein [Geminicoccaceae bacterium]|nr:CbtB domain-containing protein [Geminicoccaceae bacterium]